MATMRRVRLYMFLAFIAIVALLWHRSSSSSSKSTTPDFYESTKNALARNHDTYQEHNLDDEAHRAAAQQQRLRDAEAVAKDNANTKAPKPKPIKGANRQQTLADDTSDRNVAGRKKYPKTPEEENIEEVSSEEHDVTVELNGILHKSPIIIFSKSYCPHSQRAKDILLDKYDIVPKPYVVELDQHPMGALLQDKLHRTTGRRTVPNVLVNGKSIGGGDDIAGLDEHKELASKLLGMAGKQMQKVELN